MHIKLKIPFYYQLISCVFDQVKMHICMKMFVLKFGGFFFHCNIICNGIQL